MKQITINTYEITELSEKAKEKAYYKWLDGWDYFWSGDNEESLKKFAEIFPIKIRNWSYGGRGKGVDWTFTKRDEVEELSGWRLATYLWNNYGHIIYKKKYRNSFLRKNRIVHKMVRQEYRKNKYGEESYWTTVSSNLFRETYNCPLTGYYIDNSLFHPIWEFMNKPDNTTFHDLLDNCLEQWVKDCAEDYEHCSSMEYFTEECESNGWQFDEKGRMI